MSSKDAVALIVLLIISVAVYRRIKKFVGSVEGGDSARFVRVLAPSDTIDSFASLATPQIGIKVEPFGWPQLTLQHYLEMFSSTDDVDTLQLLASVDAVVLTERLDTLQSVETQEFATTVMHLLSTLTSKGFDAQQLLLLPAVPPRQWHADDVAAINEYVSRVEQIVATELKLPKFSFLPTFCAFSQALRENNETSFIYMPADENGIQWTPNPRGYHLIAALIQQRLLGGDVSRIEPLAPPAGLSTHEAVWLQRIARDCEMQLHLAKQSDEL